MEFESFVLAAATADIADEPAAREHADAVEFRMDLADDDPLAALEAYDGELPVVATNRARWDGGEAGAERVGGDGDHERLDALVAAAEHPRVEAVDVELASVREGAGAAVVERARERGAAAVVSVHDFEATPGRERLRELLDAAVAAGDVGKLAVTARDPDDALRLLGVTREFAAAGERVATMAMGAAGSHTRAVAPLYGSRIGYAPVDPAEATAPGQFDLATLRQLIETLSAGE